MNYLDIFLGVILFYGCVRGVWNGFFVELASFVSILIGVYLSVKFSFLMKSILESRVSWSPQTIQMTAFVLTFILIVIAIILLSKLLTKLANYTGLGCFNKLFGGFFGILKMLLIVSIALNLFQKINTNYTLVAKETIAKSILYSPIQKVAAFVYPSIEEWFEGFKI